MISYFDKRFEGIENFFQKPTNKNTKIEDTFKFRHKGNRVQFEFNEQILEIVQNLSSVLNNDDASEANDLCDELTAKLKCRNKLVKMADRSDVDWETVAKYETDPIPSDEDDGKKIRQVENRALYKRESKNFNKTTVCISIQRPSGQQFLTDGEYNGFTPPNQQNFNCRIPSNNFTQCRAI